jgi:NAD-dependent deacetylase
MTAHITNKRLFDKHKTDKRRNKKQIVVLSGAGMSAESGINTFRDDDGLWEGHDVMAVASPEGWQANPKLVLEFYNQRRRQLLQVSPNQGHLSLVALEQYYDVAIVTQNVDDLHERAGSSSVLHLHGELLKSQSSINSSLVYTCKTDIDFGDECEQASQLRPFIVWFGEAVPLLDSAIEKVIKADIIIVVGTSMQVYPAAGLTSFAKPNTKIIYIDPKPSMNEALEQAHDLQVIEQTAANGLPPLVAKLTCDL